MKKETFYKVLILLLLVMNFGILGFLLISKEHDDGHGPGGIDRMIIERLKLDNRQREQFDQLKYEHHSQMIKIQEESGKLHHELFEILKKDPLDSIGKNTVILKIQNNERQKELATFEHFRKLRGILRLEQKPLFDDFVEELSRQLMRPPPDHPGNLKR